MLRRAYHITNAERLDMTSVLHIPTTMHCRVMNPRLFQKAVGFIIPNENFMILLRSNSN